jgi:hypothetical protein
MTTSLLPIISLSTQTLTWNFYLSSTRVDLMAIAAEGNIMAAAEMYVLLLVSVWITESKIGNMT